MGEGRQYERTRRGRSVHGLATRVSGFSRKIIEVEIFKDVSHPCIGTTDLAVAIGGRQYRAKWIAEGLRLPASA